MFYFDVAFLKRFWRVLKILFPRWRSITVLLFFTLLCLLFLQQVVIYHVGLLPSVYYRVLAEKDVQGFVRHLIFSIILIVSIAFINSTVTYMSSVIYVTTRSMLTLHLQKSYFQDIFYYRLNVLCDKVDNPDQRITQDVDKLCKHFSNIIAKLLIAPFTIGYYMYTTWSSTGYLGPVCVIAFFIISTVANKFIMSPVVALVYKQEWLEGNFRFRHMLIRSHAESAAFYRCGDLELEKANEKLKKLIRVQQKLVLREYPLNFSIQLSDYVGSILSYVILAPPIFNGVYDHLTPAELSQLISKNAFVTIYLIYSFSILIGLATDVASMAGVTHRVAVMLELLTEWTSQGSQLTDVDYKPDLTSPEYNGSNGQSSNELVAYKVDNLTYAPPNKTSPLVEGLSFEFKTGENILITGDSGCGKSSLIRVLDRLWRQSSGEIKRNVVHGHQGVLFLPQNPMLTDGSLRDQIIYPYKEVRSGGLEDGEILEYLRKTDLMSLYDRVGGLDADVQWNWYDHLSPGELQRLSFVRLFFHRPPFAVLDEATSQVSVNMEQLLYGLCEQLGITVMSVGHRTTLYKYHHVQIHLSGHGKWQCSNLREQDLTHL